MACSQEEQAMRAYPARRRRSNEGFAPLNSRLRLCPVLGSSALLLLELPVAVRRRRALIYPKLDTIKGKGFLRWVLVEAIKETAPSQLQRIA
jgi:hypothetical protein